MLLSDAGFSADLVYRYWLLRQWDLAKPTLVVIGLNPSTADATRDDPTIRRCLGYACDWGFGALKMLNIFALRSTDPAKLYQVGDPIGPGNNAALEEHTRDVPVVLLAWGTHGAINNRGVDVAKQLKMLGRPLRCLRRTQQGHPAHPLYLPKNLKPMEYTA